MALNQIFSGNEILAEDILSELGDLADEWTTWSPTLANLTLGNGTVTAKRRLVGKTLDWRFRFVLGTTSAVGTAPSFTLPFAAHAEYALFDKAGAGTALNAGVAGYDVSLRFVTNTSTVEFVTIGTNGLHASVSATVPFTFGTDDSLFAFGTIELA